MNGHEDYWTGNNASDREDLNPLCSFALSLGLDQHGLRKRLENLEKLTLSLVPVVPEPPVIEALRSTDV